MDVREIVRSFCRAPVKSLSKVVALLLLVLWLPATLHCGLEAIGAEFFSHCDEGAGACKEVCAKDNCQTAEGAMLRKVGLSARVLAPVMVEFATLLAVVPALTPDLAPVTPALRAPEIERVARTWSFVRRAALPARAPNSLA